MLFGISFGEILVIFAVGTVALGEQCNHRQACRASGFVGRDAAMHQCCDEELKLVTRSQRYYWGSPPGGEIDGASGRLLVGSTLQVLLLHTDGGARQSVLRKLFHALHRPRCSGKDVMQVTSRNDFP